MPELPAIAICQQDRPEMADFAAMKFLVRPVLWSEKDTIQVEAETADEAVKKWPDEVIKVILKEAKKNFDIDTAKPDVKESVEKTSKMCKQVFSSLPCVVKPKP